MPYSRQLRSWRRGLFKSWMKPNSALVAMSLKKALLRRPLHELFSMPEFDTGEVCLLTVGASLLTIKKLLCLQSLMALIRRTFPL